MTTAATTPASVTVRAPAKINLELRVGPPREDGFHPLSTVYQAVGLYDEVTAEPAEEWGITVHGPTAVGVPADDDNLAVRAARALAETGGIDEPVHLTVRKEIPVAGGMAGGSADAAAALVACDQLWGLASTREGLEEVASGLGSDVPFLVAGGTAMGSGRGEVLAPVLARGTYHWVLVFADRGLSTPEVYRRLDEQQAGSDWAQPQANPRLMAALRSGDPVALAEQVHNDLQPAAVSLAPELSDLLEAAEDFGALAGIVSGSGPTLAFLTAGNEASLDLAVSLTASGASTRVKRVTGPVHGAQVVAGPRTD